MSGVSVKKVQTIFELQGQLLSPLENCNLPATSNKVANKLLGPNCPVTGLTSAEMHWLVSWRTKANSFRSVKIEIHEFEFKRHIVFELVRCTQKLLAQNFRGPDSVKLNIAEPSHTVQGCYSDGTAELVVP